jgi:hypothetical protein
LAVAITYNYGGSLRGDLLEALDQSILPFTTTPDGRKLIDNAVKDMKEAEGRYQELNKKIDCKCKIPRPNFLIIAESQGNFFAEDIINNLPSEIAERMGILSISSFTDYGKARSKIENILQYLLQMI